MDAISIVLEYVFPSIGILTGNLMFLAPLEAIRRCRTQRRHAPDANAYVYALTVLNCTAWQFYGLLGRDYFVFFANWPGALLGLFFLLSLWPYMDPRTADRTAGLLIPGMGVVWMAAMVSWISVDDTDGTTRQLILGFTANSILAVYYVSPLSVAWTVVRRKNSAYLHVPLSMCATANGTLWAGYGYFISDLFIA